MSKLKTIAEIPISKIDFEDDTFKNRKSIEKDLDQLRQSLKQEGQQVPAELRKKNNGNYQIISGFRRCAALISLRKKNVMAFVHPPDTDIIALHRLSLIENLQREDLSELEKIDACASLFNQKVPKKELAKIYGVGVRAIEYYIKVSTQASPELRKAIDNGLMTLHQARFLIGKDDKTIQTAIIKARKGKFTVSEAKKLIGKRRTSAKPINQTRRFKKGFNLKIRFRLDYDETTKKQIKASLQEALEMLEGDIKPAKDSWIEKRLDSLSGYWKGKIEQKDEKGVLRDSEVTATLDANDTTISGEAQFITFYGKFTKLQLYKGEFDGNIIKFEYRNELNHIKQKGSIWGQLNSHGDAIRGEFTGYSPELEKIVSGKIYFSKEKIK